MKMSIFMSVCIHLQIGVCVCVSVSLLPVNCAEHPQTSPACVVLCTSNERGAGGRQARLAAEQREGDSSSSAAPDYK